MQPASSRARRRRAASAAVLLFTPPLLVFGDDVLAFVEAGAEAEGEPETAVDPEPLLLVSSCSLEPPPPRGSMGTSPVDGKTMPSDTILSRRDWSTCAFSFPGSSSITRRTFSASSACSADPATGVGAGLVLLTTRALNEPDRERLAPNEPERGRRWDVAGTLAMRTLTTS